MNATNGKPARTEPSATLARYKLELGAAINPAWINDAHPMPRTVGECEAQGLGRESGPCPFLRCGWNLAIDVNPDTGSVTLNAPFTIDDDGVPDLDLAAIPHTCAIAAVDGGPMTLQEIGLVLGLRKTGVEAAEKVILAKLRATAPPLESFDEPNHRAPSVWEMAEPEGELLGVGDLKRRAPREVRQEFRDAGHRLQGGRVALSRSDRVERLRAAVRRKAAA